MNQIIFIHGGELFSDQQDYYDFLSSYRYDPYKQKDRWHIHLDKQKDFDVFRPTMPWKYNSDYTAWKIWFEKLFPYLGDEKIVLIGHSLGALFLVKYLSENGFPKKIAQLHLVGGCFYDTPGQNFHLQHIDQIGDIEDMVDHIFIYHSKDDSVVAYEHAEKYLKYLPKAQLEPFEDRGHFLQPEFPELIENIKHNL